MARTRRELKGFLYNIKALIDGFIRMLDVTPIDPDQIETAFFDTIIKEQEKLNKSQNPEP